MFQRELTHIQYEKSELKRNTRWNNSQVLMNSNDSVDWLHLFLIHTMEMKKKITFGVLNYKPGMNSVS